MRGAFYEISIFERSDSSKPCRIKWWSFTRTL